MLGKQQIPTQNHHFGCFTALSEGQFIAGNTHTWCYHSKVVGIHSSICIQTCKCVEPIAILCTTQVAGVNWLSLPREWSYIHTGLHSTQVILSNGHTLERDIKLNKLYIKL